MLNVMTRVECGFCQEERFVFDEHGECPSCGQPGFLVPTEYNVEVLEIDAGVYVEVY